ncbi:unnamed protein product [Phytomonas sp. EM1]|nr:unnamed protein product [Phytomonas sp. EM1]|eukprot:CCW61902.1 unnamed protein product [Phytomonas sp. isolate EM1]
MSQTDSSNLEALLFEKAKAYLMRANKDGVSVYDQLVRIMELLLDENPEDAAHNPEKFENVLRLLQKHAFVLGESTDSCNEPASISPIELKYLRENEALFQRPEPEVQTTIEQPDPCTTVTTTKIKPLTAPSCDSITQHNKFWSEAGYGMTEEEAFFFERSITKLAMDKGLAEVRFVGKIFGRYANYIVISSRRYLQPGEKIYQEINTIPKPPRKKAEVPTQPEPGFVGTNRLSYWVASRPSSGWVLLPDVTPQQINAARRINSRFTGNLDADVVGNPPFPWKESVYLRAQLSRIVSGTFISPVGALERPEEDSEEFESEEYADDDEQFSHTQPKEAKYRPLTVPAPGYGEDEMDVAQLASLDQWVHSDSMILNNGRQTKVPEKIENEDEEQDEDKDNQDVESDEEEEVEEEEEPELFSPIKTDYLHAVINIPQPPPDLDEEEEEEEKTQEGAEGEQEEEPEDNTPVKPLNDDDVPDDDVTRLKVAAWKIRIVNNTNKDHRIVAVHSLRWPGAFAYAGNNGKRWGCAYFGSGLKKMDYVFTPPPAPPILSECSDLVEAMDPTAAVEKLARRGEEPPEGDSEDELEEAEDGGAM